jgi:hypothetical protein
MTKEEETRDTVENVLAAARDIRLWETVLKAAEFVERTKPPIPNGLLVTDTYKYDDIDIEVNCIHYSKRFPDSKVKYPDSKVKYQDANLQSIVVDFKVPDQCLIRWEADGFCTYQSNNSTVEHHFVAWTGSKVHIRGSSIWVQHVENNFDATSFGDILLMLKLKLSA